jgi:uncharacterized protein (PEP-CTERM system associated)
VRRRHGVRLADGACVALALAIGAAHAQVVSPVVPPPTPLDPARRQAEELLARQEAQTQQRPLTIVPTLIVELTATDNVNLEPGPRRRSDFVTQIAPGCTISGRTPRLVVEGAVAAPILIYANTGDENNRVVPHVNVVGTLEAVERLVFVEAAAHATQEYFTPFGARSASIVSNPANAYVSQVYSVSPYIRSTTPGGLVYELRDDNIWANLNSEPIETARSYTNRLRGHVAREPLPLGWALEYERNEIDFEGQDSQLLELARAVARYRPDPSLELAAGVGYERNQFPLTDFDDIIYSAGVRWRPTQRTTVDAFWEHRFFGSSYRFVFDHRTPLTVWQVLASRNVTSYPQVIADIGAGTIVPLMLDALFSSRIPDDAQRAQFVLQFMRDRGLPLVMTSPLTLYTQQIYLEERASATVGLIGARNTLFMSAYRLRTQPLSGSGVVLPPAFDLLNNNTQTGAGVAWTYRLSGTSTFNAAADYLHTAANPPLEGESDQATLRMVWTTSISPNTSAYAGARYQSLRSDFNDPTRELAGYVGLTHTFR